MSPKTPKWFIYSTSNLLAYLTTSLFIRDDANYRLSILCISVLQRWQNMHSIIQQNCMKIFYITVKHLAFKAAFSHVIYKI